MSRWEAIRKLSRRGEADNDAERTSSRQPRVIEIDASSVLLTQRGSNISDLQDRISELQNENHKLLTAIESQRYHGHHSQQQPAGTNTPCFTSQNPQVDEEQAQHSILASTRSESSRIPEAGSWASPPGPVQMPCTDSGTGDHVRVEALSRDSSTSTTPAAAPQQPMVDISVLARTTVTVPLSAELEETLSEYVFERKKNAELTSSNRGR